jgi:WD40 repeat protein
VILSPDGQRIVSGSHHDGVCLWDADTGELITRIFKSGRIWGLAYASDGVRLVVASSEGHYVLNTRSGEISADLGQPPGAGGTADAVLDPTCSRILIADGGPLRSFDEQTLEPAIVVPERTSICAISSAAEPILATSKGASGREIVLWNLASLEKTCVLKGHAAGVTQAAFSADGTRLATASEDGTICVWEVYGSEESLPEGEALLVREPSATLRNHKGRAFAVAWSPDGTRLATGADDRVIRLWETATFQEVAVLSGHRDYVWSLVWSQDGRCLISGSGDTTVRVWESEPERVRISARRERATILQELEPVVLKWFEEWQSAQRVLDRLDQEEGIAGRRREVAEQIILRISVENR